jgi:hypothetical protein
MRYGGEVLGRVKASFAVAHRFAALTRPPRFVPRHLWNASKTYRPASRSTAYARYHSAPRSHPQRSRRTHLGKLRTQIDGGFSGFMESASRRDRHCL